MSGPGNRGIHTPALRAEVAAIWLLLVLILLHVFNTYDPFPLWSDDPSEVPVAVDSLTPATSVLLDAGIMLASILALLSAARAGRRPPAIPLLLAAVGAGGVAFHAFGGSIDNLVQGAAWTTAITAGLATMNSARDARLRRLIAAALLGSICILALKSAVQVFVEHPQVMAVFNRDRAQIIESKGWTEDSPMARAFIRRAEQAEATAWFGLANVLATFAAACFVSFTGLTIAARRSGPRIAFALGVAAAASLMTLILADSKGGYTAAALGLCLLATPALLKQLAATPGPLPWVARRRATAGALGVGVVVAAVLAIVMRGMIGERLHELSLLFRWFYISTAARVFAAHPLTGVGPDGFQAAYSLLKPPISPETVSSPHSILFDWAATLGICGLAWGVLLLMLAFGAGSHLLARLSPTLGREEPADAAHQQRSEVHFVLGALAIPVLISAFIEMPLASIPSTLVRLVGLILAGVVVTAMLSLMRSGVVTRIALAAGALAALAHAQIELTGSQVTSCAWLFAFAGLAAAPVPPDPMVAQARARKRGVRALTPALLAALVAFALATAFRAVTRLAPWESALRSAAAQVAPAAGAAAELREIEVTPMPREDSDLATATLAKQLSNLTGRRVGASPEQLHAAIGALQVVALPKADPFLSQARAAAPAHLPTARAASQLRLKLATIAMRGRDRATAMRLLDEGEAMITAFTDLQPSNSSAWAWLGMYRQGRGALESNTSRLPGAIDAWKRAAQLDPYNLTHTLMISRAYTSLGRIEEAAQWARTTLDLDMNMRLDPSIGLTDNQRRELHSRLP